MSSWNLTLLLILGEWAAKFETEDTKRDNFYVSHDQITMTKYMKQKGKFNYYTSEELRAHVLQMPYKGDDISMIIILPPFEDDALYTTVQKMTPETIQGVMAEVRSGFYEVDDLTVEIPKFKIEQSLELSDTLSKLGASFLGWVDLTLKFLIKTELFQKLINLHRCQNIFWKYWTLFFFFFKLATFVLLDHRFGRVEFRMLNICFDFFKCPCLLEKQQQKFDISKLLRYQRHLEHVCSKVEIF